MASFQVTMTTVTYPTNRSNIDAQLDDLIEPILTPAEVLARVHQLNLAQQTIQDRQDLLVRELDLSLLNHLWKLIKANS